MKQPYSVCFVLYLQSNSYRIVTRIVIDIPCHPPIKKFVSDVARSVAINVTLRSNVGVTLSALK